MHKSTAESANLASYWELEKQMCPLDIVQLPLNKSKTD